MQTAALRTTQPRTKLRVDRAGAGKILGASLATKGPAIGHGFQLDDKSIDQIAKLAKGEPVGWWTHCFGEDGLGAHLGRWTNPRREGEKAVGDFEFSATAKHVRPAGLSVDAATYLMDLAEQDPEAFGVSPFIEFTLEPVDGGLPAARVTGLNRGDFTAFPAANPNGLLSARPPQEGSMDLETLKKENAALAAARDAQATELAALKAGLKAATEREAARRKAENEAFVAGLQARATAAQCPLSAEELGHVTVLLERGDDATAKIVGGLLVSRSEALGVKPGVTGQTLGAPNTATETQKAETAYLAAQLRESGWQVEVSTDGTQITKKTPPAKAGR